MKIVLLEKLTTDFVQKLKPAFEKGTNIYHCTKIGLIIESKRRTRIKVSKNVISFYY